jgi:hypothetical protein
MSDRQKNAVTAFFAKLYEVRGISEPQNAISEEGSLLLIKLPLSGWPIISVGKLGGYGMPEIRSYPENGRPSCYAYPGNTALDAALFGDKHLARQQGQASARKTIAIVTSCSGSRVDKSESGSTPTKNWRECAEFYLAELWEQDRQLVCNFSAGEVTCEMLRDLFSPNRYQAARSVPGRIAELGVEKKYRPFVVMLNAHRDTEMTTRNVPVVIEQALPTITRAYGTPCLSAVSKAFWMMKQHPVVIYDRKARAGLRRSGLLSGENDYGVFFRSWFEFFERRDTQAGLDEALSWLPNSQSANNFLKAKKVPAPDLTNLAVLQWFRNRVTDMKLTNCLA